MKSINGIKADADKVEQAKKLAKQVVDDLEDCQKKTQDLANYIGDSDWDGEFANKVKDVLQIIAEFQNKLNKPLSDHQTALENLSENLDKYDTLAIKEALEKVEI